jgi:hypothetical protein
MIIGLLLTLVLYFLANLVYLRALPIEELGQVNGIGEASATALFGVSWAPLITLAVFTSIFGCLASGVLTSSRIYLPMAQDGVFFRSLAKIHRRVHVPCRHGRGRNRLAPQAARPAASLSDVGISLDADPVHPDFTGFRDKHGVRAAGRIVLGHRSRCSGPAGVCVVAP